MIGAWKKYRLWAVLGALMLTNVSLWAQEKENKNIKKSESLMRQAERSVKEGDFVKAESEYREALSKNPSNAKANYNFGHLYADKEMEAESMNQLLKTVKTAQSKEIKHKAFHNLGNAYMAQEDYAQAVRAYKDALRNDPTDDETRYNLAIAKDKLEKNPDQNQDENQDQDQDEDQDQSDNSRDNKESKDNQDQGDDQDQNKDQGDDQEDQNQQGQDQESEGGEDQNNEEGQQDQNNPEENQGENPQQDESNQDQQSQPDDGKMSDEQAENLLRAADNLEKGVQKKLNEQKGEKTPPQKNQKDW